MTVRILYAKKIMNRSQDVFTAAEITETFQSAIVYNQKLMKHDLKTAYFFIDPLMHPFEAGNQFYCGCLQIPLLYKLNCYKSGAGPLQALADAWQLIESHLYDAVFIFGYEPLLANKIKYSKETIQKSMDIFDGPSLIYCYNQLSHLLCSLYNISTEDFTALAVLLFQNYCRTYFRMNPQIPEPNPDPQKLDALGGDLFRLVDCANPNVNFAGGIILGSDLAADVMKIPTAKQVEVLAAKQAQVEGHPEKLASILGEKENIFPHLQHLFRQMQDETKLDFKRELAFDNLLLEVYTCYPPIPIAFLLAGGFIENLEQLPAFLEKYDLTVTGGLNLAGAPWNNPVLHGIIEMYRYLSEGKARYGLVHGNGGLGEVQSVALLKSPEI